MLIYLAGPMRGYPLFNFPAFHDAAKDLRGRGHTVLSPAEHDEEEGFDPSTSLDGFDLQAALRWDFESVLRADAVVVLPAWHGSEGANQEVNLARLVGTPVLDYPNLEPAKSESIAAEAMRIVHGARQASYGHPAEDFTRTGRLWGAILGIDDVHPHLVGLCMAAVKISRHVNAPKRDNLVDLIGYAETVNLIHEYQQAKGN